MTVLFETDHVEWAVQRYRLAPRHPHLSSGNEDEADDTDQRKEARHVPRVCASVNHCQRELLLGFALYGVERRKAFMTATEEGK